MSVPYVTVETFSITRLRNGELYTFVKRTVDDIPYDADEEESGGDGPQVQSLSRAASLAASKISVPAELIEKTNEKLEALSYLTREGRATEETAQLENLDKLRSESALYVLNRVSAAAISPIESERKAGEQMQSKLKMYTGINRLPVYDKTGVIQGLYADVTREEFADSYAELGIEAATEQMKSYNDQYEQIAKQREAVLTEAGDTTKAKALRTEIMDLYQEITDRAFATNLLTPNDEALGFLKRLNTRINDFRARLARRGTTDKEEEEDGETPTNPDEGGDDRPVVQ